MSSPHQATMVAGEELLSTADAAKILGLSADMVRLLAREGRLPVASQSVHGRRMYRLSDVEGLAADRARAGGRGHVVQFYEADDFLVGTVASVVASSLRSGAVFVLIATEPHRDELLKKLDADGLDIAAALASGQLSYHEAGQLLTTFMVDGMPDAPLFTERIGRIIESARARRPHARVGAYGEMVNLLWGEGRPEAAIRLEELWSELARSRPFSLLCSYCMENFRDPEHGEQFQQICRIHSHVTPAESYSRRAKPDDALVAIALLQQRARALEGEMGLRKQCEEQLRQAVVDRELAEQAARRSEEELRRQNQKLEDALRARAELLARLGQELRNPLAPIQAALEVLRLRGVSSSEHTLILRQVDYLGRLMDDLLDISRLARGAVELRRRNVELAQVVARGIEMSNPLFEQRCLQLDSSIPDGLLVDVDPDRMAQVVANLLINAAQYSERGSPVQVRAVRSGRSIRLSVADQGVGIAPDMLGRVFESFVHEPSPTSQQGGLGLGLTIAHNLVALHGGTLTAHSDGPGKGSRFEAELPVPQSGSAAPPSTSEQAPRRRAKASKSRRVLVVDDNADLASLIAELLRHLGHEVELAHDGPAALVAAERFLPDVALLDIDLPGMDGYELAGRLRVLGQDKIQLVALSGYGEEADRLRSEEAGFSEHLVKPVAPDLLARVVGDGT